MIPAKTPQIVKHFLGGYVWDKPNKKNKIYLTFDDGPIPEVTPWVLKVLKQYSISATFFCVGENVARHPDIFKKIIDDGHSVGNHTYNHLKGWKTKTEDYLENVKKAQLEISKHGLSSKLLRPPYGKLTPAQTKSLFSLNYDIIMWSVLSKDYLQTISSDKVLDNITSNTTSGSIIVCHDNIKAFNNLKAILPQALESLLKRNFTFSKL